MTLTRRWAAIAVLPAIVAAGLLTIDAARIYQTLGRWPSPQDTSISPDVRLAGVIVGLTMLVLYAVPAAMLVCARAPRFERAIPYLGLCWLVYFGVAVCVYLVPHPFLVWWLD